MKIGRKGGFYINSKTKSLCAVALCAVIIAVCSQIMIPMPVPFTVQTFAVFFSLLILGGVRGLEAIFIYILLGVVGVPVFSGFSAGAGHLLGPTGGYIIGFLLSALVYLLFEKSVKTDKMKFAVLLLCLAVCYFFGTLWYCIYSKGQTGFFSALALCVLPYILPDIAKILLAIYLDKKITPKLKLK